MGAARACSSRTQSAPGRLVDQPPSNECHVSDVTYTCRTEKPGGAKFDLFQIQSESSNTIRNTSGNLQEYYRITSGPLGSLGEPWGAWGNSAEGRNHAKSQAASHV